MKNLLKSITDRTEALNSIKNLFEKHPDLTKIELSYYFEEDDSQLLMGIPTLQIADQIWESNNVWDLDDEDEDSDGFEEFDFSEINNSKILNEKELITLQDSLQLLLMSTEETEVEYVTILREEILDTNISLRRD